MYPYENYYPTYPSINTSSTNDSSMIIIIAFSIVITVLVYALFMDKKNEKNLDRNAKKIYDFFHFKKLYLEEILKICYLFSTVLINIIAFSTIMKDFISFIIIFMVGNISLRIVYELIFMFIHLHDDVRELKNKKKWLPKSFFYLTNLFHHLF